MSAAIFMKSVTSYGLPWHMWQLYTNQPFSALDCQEETNALHPRELKAKTATKKDFCCIKLETEPSYKACKSVTTHYACFQAMFQMHHILFLSSSHEPCSYFTTAGHPSLVNFENIPKNVTVILSIIRCLTDIK